MRWLLRARPPLDARLSRAVAATLLAVIGAASSGCVIVPQSRRGALADPTMLPVEDSLEAKARDKLHTTREAASGGNGQPAGDGCACGN